MPDRKTPESDPVTPEKATRASKSAIKRELAELRSLAITLIDIPTDRLDQLSHDSLKEAVAQARNIKSGGAKKRHLQYITKLLSQIDTKEIEQIGEDFKANSMQSKQHFHKLEQWRDLLIHQDGEILGTIFAECPHTDKQHLRQLVKQAINEQAHHPEKSDNYRKLFRYLRELVEYAG